MPKKKKNITVDTAMIKDTSNYEFGEEGWRAPRSQSLDAFLAEFEARINAEHPDKPVPPKPALCEWCDGACGLPPVNYISGPHSHGWFSLECIWLYHQMVEAVENDDS